MKLYYGSTIENLIGEYESYDYTMEAISAYLLEVLNVDSYYRHISYINKSILKVDFGNHNNFFWLISN